MKKEKIIELLKDFKTNNNYFIIDDLIDSLTNEVRKESNYKITSKSRVNAIEKLLKENNKKGRERYNKAFINKDQFIFTNSYYMVSINDDLGIEKDDKDYSSFIDNVKFNYTDDLNIDINDITASYKLKAKYYNINGIDYDINYLKQVIDILGSDINCYQTLQKEMLYFENSKNEKAVLIGTRTY